MFAVRQSRLSHAARLVGPSRNAALFHVSALRLDAQQAPSSESVQEDIRTQLRTALKAAMKGKDKEVAGSIKAILADITYFEKAGKDPHAAASEDSVVDVLRKAIDTRTQASQQYPPEHDNHKSLLSEISLISGFLPKALTMAALTKAVTMAISALTSEQRTSKGATGIVLEKLWEQVKKSEVADKKGLGKLVGEMLKKST